MVLNLVHRRIVEAVRLGEVEAEVLRQAERVDLRRICSPTARQLRILVEAV